jgi:hypothetical protein
VQAAPGDVAALVAGRGVRRGGDITPERPGRRVRLGQGAREGREPPSGGYRVKRTASKESCLYEVADSPVASLSSTYSVPLLLK